MINISNGKNSKIVIKNCNNSKKGSPNPELVKVVMDALPTLAKTVIDVFKK